MDDDLGIPITQAEPFFRREEEDRRGLTASRRVAIHATPFRWRDPSSIPPREWLCGRHLIRRYVSATVAPGGLGKSSLLIVEALAMVTGRPLLGVAPEKPLRVWYFNGEDPADEIERRIAAACLHHGIRPEEIEGRLFVDSGRATEIVIAHESRDGVTVVRPVVEAIEATIRENRIDVMIIDPFVSSHRVNENDNMAIDTVASAWAGIAERMGIAVELVHPVRKGQAGKNEHTVEDGRGAGALLAKARSARVLNGMPSAMAEKHGIERPRSYFSVQNGKANLAPASDKSDWFRFVSEPLGNGDDIGVVVAWKPPNPLDDITVADLRRAQEAVSRAGPWRESPQSTDWVGSPIAEALSISFDDRGKARIRDLLKTWLASGAFIVFEGKDEYRQTKKFVRVGELA